MVRGGDLPVSPATYISGSSLLVEMRISNSWWGTPTKCRSECSTALGTYSLRLARSLDTRDGAAAAVGASASLWAAVSRPRCTGGPRSPRTCRQVRGFHSRVQATKALLMTLASHPGAESQAMTAFAVSDRQGAHPWRELSNLAIAATAGGVSAAVQSVPTSLQWVLSAAAELLIAHLAHLDDRSMDVVRTECRRRPDRWLPALRRAVADPAFQHAVYAGRLLATVGEPEDVGLLEAVVAGEEVERSGSSFGKDR